MKPAAPVAGPVETAPATALSHVSPARTVRTTVIKPSRGLARVSPREWWDSRELLYFLTWRDIKVRYRQTVFGAAWAVLPPVLMMLIFWIFLGRLARVPSDGVPYPVFALAGLIPWMFFAQVLQGDSECLVRSPDLITKVYFPRLFLPASVAASYVLDYVVALAVLAVVMVIAGVGISSNVIWLPILTALVALTALSVGIWLAALNVRYRDVRHTVPFLIQVLLFLTPVVYPASLIPQRWQAIYAINPMAGVVEGFRWTVLGSGTFPGLLLAISGVVTLGLLITGITYFQRVERTFADVI